jgi:hypothetical protein
MAAESTSESNEKPRTLRGQLVGVVATKLILYVLLPALGLIGYVAVELAGSSNPLGLKRDFAGLQVTGLVVLLFLLTAIFLFFTAFFTVREVRRWRKNENTVS